MDDRLPERQEIKGGRAKAATVSVIIPVVNGAYTVARAIRSALREPETVEVILVDDASTDDTVCRAREADDGTGRLKILMQPCNLGPSAARNRALEESRAPWIALLDADDFFLPGRLARLIAAADDADFLADDIGLASEGALDAPRQSLLRGAAVAVPAVAAGRISLADFVLANVSDRRRHRYELGYVKPIMRRDFLDRHQLRYQESMRLGEDYEFYARALIHGARFKVLPVEGYVAVARPGSLSMEHTETDLLLLRNCDEALSAIPHLSERERMTLRRHYLSTDCRLQWRLLVKAIKLRDPRSAVAAFARPFPVPLYLLGQLWEQLMVRTKKMLRSRG